MPMSIQGKYTFEHSECLTYFASIPGSSLPTLPDSSCSGYVIEVIHHVSVVPQT